MLVLKTCIETTDNTTGIDNNNKTNSPNPPPSQY